MLEPFLFIRPLVALAAAFPWVVAFQLAVTSLVVASSLDLSTLATASLAAVTSSWVTAASSLVTLVITSSLVLPSLGSR